MFFFKSSKQKNLSVTFMILKDKIEPGFHENPGYYFGYEGRSALHIKHVYTDCHDLVKIRETFDKVNFFKDFCSAVPSRT